MLRVTVEGATLTLNVRLGPQVRVRSLTAVNGWREHKAAGVDVPEVMEEIYTAGCGAEVEGDRFPCGKIGPHLLTGPIAIAGAEVGDILQVRPSIRHQFDIGCCGWCVGSPEPRPEVAVGRSGVFSTAAL